MTDSPETGAVSVNPDLSDIHSRQPVLRFNQHPAGKVKP